MKKELAGEVNELTDELLQLEHQLAEAKLC